jgi:hypothetical protein
VFVQEMHVAEEQPGGGPKALVDVRVEQGLGQSKEVSESGLDFGGTGLFVRKLVHGRFSSRSQERPPAALDPGAEAFSGSRGRSAWPRKIAMIPGITSFCVRNELPVGTLICRVTAVSGRQVIVTAPPAESATFQTGTKK